MLAAVLSPPQARPEISSAVSLSSLLTELERCLSEQTEAHRRLATLLEEERRALVGLQIATIHGCASRKAELAQAIAQSEVRRRAVCDALVPALGLASTPGIAVKLGAIIEAAPEPHRPLLRDLRSDLLAAMEATQTGQGRNRTLTERFLGVLSQSMEAVQQAVAAMPLYTTAAKVGKAHWRGCVLSQTA